MAVLLLALSTMIILGVYWMSTTEATLLTDVEPKETVVAVEAVEEDDFSIAKIIAICIVSIVLLIGTVLGLIRLFGGPLLLKEQWSLLRNERQAEVYLLKSRWAMKEEQKCKKTKEGIDNPIEFKVEFQKDQLTVFCPREFSFNSIWWALRTDAKPEDVYELNASEVKYDEINDLFVVKSLHITSLNVEALGNLLVNRGACIRKRVPGIDNVIPTLSHVLDSDFSAEYEAFSQYAHRIGVECTIKDQREDESDIECKISTSTDELIKYVQCPSKPTIASVFKTIAAGNHFGMDDKLEVSWSEVNLVKKLSVSNFYITWSSSKFYLWRMYEAMQCYTD